MSFILDALRKSEHQRQRQAGPYVAQAPLGRSSARIPMVLLIVAVLLIVNLVVLVLFLLRDDTPVVVEAPAQPAAGPSPMAAAEPVPAQAPAMTAPELVMAPPAQPVQQVQAPPGVTYVPPPSREAPEPPPAYLLPEPESTAYEPAPQRANAAANETLPLPLSMLPPQATAGLPQLTLDLHVYSPDPTQRAVFINGRRYLEGDTLNEGADLVSISSEGAVLDYRGQRFLLPRP